MAALLMVRMVGVWVGPVGGVPDGARRREERDIYNRALARAPRLLYFAAVQLWTAAGGGLPRAICRGPGAEPWCRADEGKHWVRRSSFGRTVARHQSRSLRSDGDGDRLGDDLLLGDGLARIAQVIKVEADRLLGVLDALNHGLPFGDAPRQSGHGDGVTAVLGVGVEQDRVGRRPTHDSRLQQTRKLIASDLCGLKDCRERLRLENPAGMNRDHNSRSGTLGMHQNHMGTGLTAHSPPRAVQRSEQISAGNARRSGHVGAWYRTAEVSPRPDRVGNCRAGRPVG